MFITSLEESMKLNNVTFIIIPQKYLTLFFIVATLKLAYCCMIKVMYNKRRMRT